MKNYKETKDFTAEITRYKEQIEKDKLKRMVDCVLKDQIRYGMRKLGLSEDINLLLEAERKFNEYESKGYDYDDSMELVMYFIAGVSGITNRDKIENAIFAVLAYDPYFKYEVNKVVKDHFFISLVIFLFVGYLFELLLISSLLALSFSTAVALIITVLVVAIFAWKVIKYFSMLV